ncbi:MAG: hypothetical protein JO000_21885 [Alphaproteobacteria bacterium]|nr:hypothetical protein [Alphaproteobacteria bacterium]
MSRYIPSILQILIGSVLIGFAVVHFIGDTAIHSAAKPTAPSSHTLAAD